MPVNKESRKSSYTVDLSSLEWFIVKHNSSVQVSGSCNRSLIHRACIIEEPILLRVCWVDLAPNNGRTATSTLRANVERWWRWWWSKGGRGNSIASAQNKVSRTRSRWFKVVLCKAGRNVACFRRRQLPWRCNYLRKHERHPYIQFACEVIHFWWYVMELALVADAIQFRTCRNSRALRTHVI